MVVGAPNLGVKKDDVFYKAKCPNSFLVYDVNTDHTLAAAKNLAHEMDRVGLPYITVANKIDLEVRTPPSTLQRHFHFRLSAKEVGF